MRRRYRRVPGVEADLAKVGVEAQGVHLDAKGGDVLFLELARQVALDERRFAGAAVADQHELERGDLHWKKSPATPTQPTQCSSRSQR